MHTSNSFIRWRAGKGSFASFFCLFFLSLFAHPGATGQQAVVPQAFDGSAMNQPQNDLTLTGTVEKVVEPTAAGVPGGVQVIVEGPGGTFTALLGAKLTAAMKQSLAPGAPITASGVSKTINANSYLIVRKLTVSGIPFIIRNEHGFTVHPLERSRASAANATPGGAK